jgi:hypothetical protein
VKILSPSIFTDIAISTLDHDSHCEYSLKDQMTLDQNWGIPAKTENSMNISFKETLNFILG